MSAYMIDGSPAHLGFPQAIRIDSRDADGFVWATTLDNSRTVVRLAPSEVYPSAYALGRAIGCTPGNRPWRDVADFSDASASWKSAQNDHAHTSYYGAGTIRDMRAYWLGRLRTARHVAARA